ncbi:MAG: MarR family winged helix-turn-helix transcriptional regulator [Oscillospiraceae bacterium]
MAKKDIGYLIKNINDRLKAKADADLRRYNLTLAQSRVLAFLNSCGGGATQKEIEVFLEVSHPTVAGIVSRMEQNGYVSCRMDKGDKRNKIVELTGQAKSMSIDMDRRVHINEQKMLASLSVDDVEHLREMLTVIYKNLE